MKTIFFNLVSIVHQKSVRMTKNQLGVGGSAGSFPQRGPAPEAFTFLAYFYLENKFFQTLTLYSWLFINSSAYA